MNENEKIFIWHPYQKLWNTALLHRIRAVLKSRYLIMPLKYFIIYLDSLILYFRMMGRKIARISKSKPDVKSVIQVFDLGAHEKAEEVQFLINSVLGNSSRNYEIHAFEAATDLCDAAKKELSAYQHVKLNNTAVCYEVPENGKLKLFTGAKDLGFSLFTEENDSYIEVDAIRLSDYIRSNNIDIENTFNILRMNIEGAEFDVLKDLDETGMLSHFYGFYGMWDDIEKKLPLDKKKEVRELLKRNKINPFTFNGRDLKWRFRKYIISSDIKHLLSFK